MKIIVTTDSTSDVPQNIVEKNKIGVMPLIVNLGDEEYLDGVNVKIQDLFNFVKNTGILPKTAARSSFNYQEFFEEHIKENKADALIHLSISSELSASYNNAKAAAQELKNVYVVDTKSLSSGCGLLVLSCIDKINEGKDITTILQEINDEIPKIQASFIISNLKYLYKGGRCTAIAMLGANILMIKPKIKLFNGKMSMDKKYMGKYEAVVMKYVNDLLHNYPDCNKERVFITFTSKNDELNANISKSLKEFGFKEIIINYAGSTIASHCGEDCIGVLFQSKTDIK